MNLRRIIVAGGRDFTDKEMLFKVLDEHIKEPCIIVCGEAKGADAYGRLYAESKGYEVLPFPAKWDDITVEGAVIKEGMYGEYNAVAGHQRNQRMADEADELILFWDGHSKGSKDMLSRAEKKGIPIKIINY